MKKLMLVFVWVALINSLLFSFDIPTSPNQYDSSGKRTGLWTQLLNDKFQYVTDIRQAKFYRIITYKSGKPFGIVKDYFLSGQIQGTSKLLSEEPDVFDGIMENYYENGNKNSRGNYIKGKPDGIHRDWFENGNLKSEMNLKKGKLNGKYKAWHENGTLAIDCNYINDKLDGTYLSWFDNGALYSQIEYKKGVLSGVYKEWIDTLYVEGTYKNGKENGKFTCWYNNGTSTSFNFKKGIVDGKCCVWDSTSYTEKYFQKGELDGRCTTWYKDAGVMLDCWYIKDLLDGPYTFNDKDGSGYAGNYYKGNANGYWTYWDSKGITTKAGYFLIGERIGFWKDYDAEENEVETPYPDGKTAFEFYKRLAANGDSSAHYNIGKLYYLGKGVIQDYEEAVKNFRLSAELGNIEAQFFMGLCYYSGFGVTQDYSKAYTWFLLACSFSSNDEYYNLATEMKNEIAASMSKSEIVRATNEAKAIQLKIDKNQKK